MKSLISALNKKNPEKNTKKRRPNEDRFGDRKVYRIHRLGRHFGFKLGQGLEQGQAWRRADISALIRRKGDAGRSLHHPEDERRQNFDETA